MLSIKSESSFSFKGDWSVDWVVVELVPSSARSSSSVASPLPSQFVPLLSDALDRVKVVLDKVMPVGKKRTALEEAEWEDEGENGSLERELMLQCKWLDLIL